MADGWTPTALWFWEDSSQNTPFVNAQRSKQLTDYYSGVGGAETLAHMRANFAVDRGCADRFAKHQPIQVSEAELQWLRKEFPGLLVDDEQPNNFALLLPRHLHPWQGYADGS